MFFNGFPSILENPQRSTEEAMTKQWTVGALAILLGVGMSASAGEKKGKSAKSEKTEVAESTPTAKKSHPVVDAVKDEVKDDAKEEALDRLEGKGSGDSQGEKLKKKAIRFGRQIP